ncbi:MAG: hypothetical protein M0Z82_05890 [Actinomycetota bacterium]|nr:hypothetical protein [Actinomycetota bacterium]
MDTLGIIRQLEGDPALRAQLRAVLLGDDMLELPELVRRLAARLEQLVDTQQRIEQRLEQLADAQQRTEQRLEQLADAQQRTEQRLEQLADAQQRTEQELAQVVIAQQAMLRWQQRADDQFAELKGSALESRVRQDPRRFVPRRLATGARLIDDARLSALLDALDEASAAEVERADALIEARLPDTSDVIFVVEAAWTAHVDDVERAQSRAATLARSGASTRALVVSHTTPDAVVLAAAGRAGVAVVGESDGLLVPRQPSAA